MEIAGPVQFMALSNIQVDETRQRKAIAPAGLEELARSIEQHGLLHPAVISGTKLVSGRRRMLAIEKLHAAEKPVFFGDYPVPKDMMPVVDKSDLDVATQREIELDENIKRVDLSWQERAAAIADLHKLRVTQDPAQTPQATGREIAAATGANPVRAQENVQRALLVQPYLDDPAVKRATSFAAAHRIAVNKIEAEFAASRKHTGVVGLTLHYGSMQNILPMLDSELVDCILADPPYGIGADEFGNAAAEIHSYDDSPEAAEYFVSELLVGVSRIAKPAAHLYLFCDIDLFVRFKLLVERAGWQSWRTPLIWHKPGAGHAPDPKRGPRRNYELILYATRGQRHLREVRSDVLTITPEANKKHAAQKPVALYTELLSRSCTVGDTVLDPCAGSGTIFAAAHVLNLKAIGVEADVKYHAMAAQRITDLGTGGSATSTSLDKL